MKAARALHAASALVAWLALALQLALIVQQVGLIWGIWRFVGYFTILTNLLIAVVATAFVVAPQSRLASPTARIAALASIVLVGVVYSVALRSTFNPQGWAKVADFGLHDVSPVLFVAAWLAAPHAGLRWQNLRWVLLPPLAYLAYALGRGAIDGWYAYWFLDPRNMNFMELATSVAILVAAFSVVGVIALATDRALARRTVN